MSFFAKLFGGGKSGETPSPSDAIQQLLLVEEMLKKKEEYIEKQIQDQILTAKHNGTKNKRVALQALKKKKKFEKQLTQLDNTLLTIEHQRDSLENASANTEVLRVMQYAAKSLEKVHDLIDVEKVHSLMDDIQELQEVEREIADAFARPLYSDFDDDDILEELNELLEDDIEAGLLDVSGTENLPDLPAPKQTDKAKVRNDDEGLKELAAWAS